MLPKVTLYFNYPAQFREKNPCKSLAEPTRSILMVRRLWLLAIVVPTVMFFARAPEAAEAPLPQAPSTATCKAQGSVGCAASSCHGSFDSEALRHAPGPDAWKTAATRFNASDPHRKAFAVLREPLADIISKGSGHNGPAIHDLRCLACHVNPTLAKDNLPSREIEMRQDGVSCEACHGNSSDWYQTHTVPGKSRDYHGFHDLRNLDLRAKLCAGCHVGAPADDKYPVRDMNHDMIAAGHPPLSFDFASQSRRLPRHWQEKENEQDIVNLWKIGETAYPQARIELLKDRATRAHGHRSPWPEFAELSCNSCHFELNPARNRKSSGIAPWSGPPLADADPLLKMMNEDKAPDPNRVAALAAAAKPPEVMALPQRLREITAKPPRTPVEAAAAFQALAVAYEARTRNGKADPTIEDALRKLAIRIEGNREQPGDLARDLAALAVTLGSD
jgi:hypothetical protein